MAGTATNDLTEEDAADLQFPKAARVLLNGESADSECANCLSELQDMYIYCAECSVNVCCSCFAKGAEFKAHKNNHRYSVLHNDFMLFEHSDWTAKEELSLVSGLLQCGSFETVAKRLNKSTRDVVEHYNYFYLQREGCKDFPVLPETRASVFPEPIIPYRFALADVREPPRSDNSHLNLGYCAARSDFEVNYDKTIELPLSQLEIHKSDSDFTPVMRELECCVVRSYNWRCMERMRRYGIIREHGLILLNKVTGWARRYDMTVTPPVYEKLLKFMQFYSGEGFEMFMEGFHRVGELKIQIARLCDMRRNGITTLKGAQLYLNLSQRRDEHTRVLKVFRTDTALIFKPLANVMPILDGIKRRGFAPLDIVGLPSYDKLLPSERDLCTVARLVPDAYLELKEVLIRENNKLGYIKLCTARKLLKIDVNKTRKLYDFLIQEGFINKQKT